MKKNFLIISLLIIIFFIQTAFALTAESNDYSVARFGTGIQATNLSSSDLEARTISTTNPSTRGAESNDYTTNIGFWSNTTYYVGVSISSYSIYPTSAVQGSIIRFSISALNSESVWAVLTLPSGSQETIALTNNRDAYYTANLIGQHNVTFYANNSQGHLASSIDTFTITSPTTPTTPPSGGGGSTTIIEKTCNYNWDCTSWSICSNGKQIRECNNIGTCNGAENKPIETRDCSDALFDVIIDLKEPILAKEDTIKFKVSLTETKGIEKIDVQIKYSIINNNNIEIFSQIETKAIKGNLSFEKEINKLKLKEEEYILRVDILYGNLQRAFSEQKFKIKDKEIRELTSSIQKIKEFLKFDNKFIILIIMLLILLFIFKERKKIIHLISKLNHFKEKIVPNKIHLESKLKSFKKTEVNKNKYLEIKPKPIVNIVFGKDKYLEIKPKQEKTLIIKIKEKIKKKKNTLSEIKGSLISFLRKYKEHPSNSIKGLVNKKVYSESGHYIGKIKEIILEENKINSLKIKIDKKHKFKSKGITINYNQVKGAGKVIIISEKVLEYVKDDKKLNS